MGERVDTAALVERTPATYPHEDTGILFVSFGDYEELRLGLEQERANRLELEVDLKDAREGWDLSLSNVKRQQVRIQLLERRNAYLEEAACICEYGPTLGDGRMDSSRCPVHDVPTPTTKMEV